MHGVREVNDALGDLIVASKTPALGATPSSSYEGDGWVIVRHPDTKVVEAAVLKIISTIRVEVA